MRSSRSRNASVFGFLGAAMLVVVIVFFLPTSLGGRTDYVITSGISMEPDIHQGDLIILRKTDDYSIGDAVAYRDPDIGRVFHRIIARDRHTFVMQGDNNSWTDNYQPSEGEIVGERWIHLPGVGTWLERVRQPIGMALLATLSGVLLLAPRRVAKRLRRAHRPPTHGRDERPRRSGSAAGILSQDGQMIMSAVGVLALASVLLAAIAYTRPTQHSTTNVVGYDQRMSFSYTAEPRGDVYEGGLVQSGQPIYLALVDDLSLSFDYSITSDLPVATSGNYQLDAIVAFDEGLTRTIPLIGTTAFDGPEVAFSTTLTLSDIQRVIDQIAQQIGANGKHTVSIVPTINLVGMVGDRAVDESFAPALLFELDSVALRPATKAATPDNANATDPFSPTKAGTVEEPATIPATISMLMLDVKVVTARQIAIVGLGLSVLGGLVVAIMLFSALRAAEPHRVKARYGHLLIQVSDSDLGMIGRVVEVISIDDLVRVAEREGRMILHQQHGAVHDYFVQDVDVTYRYWTRDASAPAANAMTEAARG
ncbi:MAG TPA: signal peptidase I [Thermomicrobiales bacterium]|nr:signal peptidase I [Thermomicrobiales bacterium]